MCSSHFCCSKSPHNQLRGETNYPVIGGAMGPGMMYFPTKWGVKAPPESSKSQGNWLVVSTHLQKYESKWVHLPQIEANINKKMKFHHPDIPLHLVKFWGVGASKSQDNQDAWRLLPKLSVLLHPNHPYPIDFDLNFQCFVHGHPIIPPLLLWWLLSKKNKNDFWKGHRRFYPPVN